jgi:hypothetical protein
MASLLGRHAPIALPSPVSSESIESGQRHTRNSRIMPELCSKISELLPSDPFSAGSGRVVERARRFALSPAAADEPFRFLVAAAPLSTRFFPWL